MGTAGPRNRRGALSTLCGIQPSRPARSVSAHLPTLPVPPSIENEDQEEAITVTEGQPARLVCNATGKNGVHQEGGLGDSGPYPAALLRVSVASPCS